MNLDPEPIDQRDQFFQAFKAGWTRRATITGRLPYTDELIWSYYLEWLDDESVAV